MIKLSILFLVGVLLGVIISWPYKVIVLTVITRKGINVDVEEKIFTVYSKAKTEFNKLKTETFAEYSEKYPEDYKIPEYYNIQRYTKRVGDGEMLHRFKITAPYSSYDTQEKDIIVHLKYIS